MYIKRLLYLLAFVPLGLFGQPYYIDSLGDDGTGDGSRGNPWFGVDHATDQCSPGDTVIALTGTFLYDTTQYINVSGTAGNPIVIISEANHPDSVIFDFTAGPTSVTPNEAIYGFFSIGDSFLVFERIRLRNVLNIDTDNGRAHGIYFQDANNITFNWVVVDSMAGRGFQTHDSRDIFYYNCDAFRCADPQDADAGNAGTGFIASGDGPNLCNEDTILLVGCRGWKCADQAFGFPYDGYVSLDSCWGFDNGNDPNFQGGGAGAGMKLGWMDNDVDPLARSITHCIFVFNRAIGFTENVGATNWMINGNVYNNLMAKNNSYREDAAYGILAEEVGFGAGTNVMTYKNNLVYGHDVTGGTCRCSH